MNVEFANLLLNIANFLFIAGSISLIIDFIRKPFKYKLWSVSLTLSAMLVIQLAYLNLDNFLSILLALPTVVYWAMATGYAIYKSLKEWIVRKKNE